MASDDATIEALADEVARLRAAVCGQVTDDTMWTLDEARIRIPMGPRNPNPRTLSEEELEEWLSDPRSMSYKALKRLRDDELCPIRAIDVGGGLRIPEKLIRRHLREREKETRPASLKQI